MEFDYPDHKLACLQAMGVDFYVRRHLAPSKQMQDAHASGLTTAAAASPADPLEQVHQNLYQEIRQCTACALHQRRIQAVPGVGKTSADWMFIGEGPGAEEDRRGEPFVGPAGKLLDKMLLAIGFHRKDVYIANVVKCRPPDNRNPRPEEIVSCYPFLKRQIQLVNPKIIIALGGVAAKTLLGQDLAVGKLRGIEHVYELSEDPRQEIPLLVTYHPAYLLRAPEQKRLVWEDLQQACTILGRALP